MLAVAALPLLALVVAAALGRLPVELAAAGVIALTFLAMMLAAIEVAPTEAAGFLDRTLSAKDHFLTLATVPAEVPFRAVVEAGAAAILRASPEPELPPRRIRPIVTSGVLSVALLALLLAIPRVAAMVASDDPLDRIAESLAESSSGLDREIATELRIVQSARKDRRLSNQQKLEKIQAALDKIEKAEQQQAQQKKGSNSGSNAGGSGGKSEQKGESQDGGQQKGEGKSQGGSDQKQGDQGEGGNSGARDAAKQELSKAAGQLQGQQSQGQGESKNGEPKKGEQQKQDQKKESGGGIQGPESNADERKPGDKQSNDPSQQGKSPDKPGNDPNQEGGNQGEGKSQQGNAQQPKQGQQGQGPGPGASSNGESSSHRPSHAPEDKPAERYYKPGEGPGGTLVDGKYVTIRVPEERERLPGTEPVAKAGDVELEVGYGNAPLPGAGSPGDVSADQPVPLEYRGALGAAK